MRQRIARLISVTAFLVAAAVLVRPLPALADAQVSAMPGTVRAGDVTTVMAGCSAVATAAVLSGTSFGGPSQIAMAKDVMNGPGAFAVSITIPASTPPGTYDLNVTCNTGESGIGTLIVASTAGPATGGGSTSTGANRNLLLGGALLLMLAASSALLRRRSSAR
jgi:hypothetical protein